MSEDKVAAYASLLISFRAYPIIFQISGQYFLQIEEVQNVLASALKQFSETPRRMLRLRLTDGKHFIAAVEMDKINQLGY